MKAPSYAVQMIASSTCDKPRRLVRLALTMFAMMFFVVSCGRPGPATKPPDVDYYTCTMHPSVRAQNPQDKCPICSMDLVPVKKKTQKEAAQGQRGHDHAKMLA